MKRCLNSSAVLQRYYRYRRVSEVVTQQRNLSSDSSRSITTTFPFAATLWTGKKKKKNFHIPSPRQPALHSFARPFCKEWVWFYTGQMPLRNSLKHMRESFAVWKVNPDVIIEAEELRPPKSIASEKVETVGDKTQLIKNILDPSFDISISWQTFTLLTFLF